MKYHDGYSIKLIKIKEECVEGMGLRSNLQQEVSKVLLDSFDTSLNGLQMQMQRLSTKRKRLQGQGATWTWTNFSYGYGGIGVNRNIGRPEDI
eukprot:scaffold1601_cov122-Skeletonema_dohrnii-CCMP3373.AAC.1